MCIAPSANVYFDGPRRSMLTIGSMAGMGRSQKIVGGPYQPFKQPNVRCGAARQRRHSLQTQNSTLVEFTHRGTNRTFAAAAIANAAFTRTCRVSVSALQPMSSDRTSSHFKIGRNHDSLPLRLGRTSEKRSNLTKDLCHCWSSICSQ